MPDKEDDPRQVLAILNSLGFVGITAEQLKAFMKDLKLLRKIKERERKQWKEEMKRKIFYKQQKALAELVGVDSPASTDENVALIASNRLSDDSVIKIRIRCISESDDDDGDIENRPPQQALRRSESPSPQRKCLSKQMKLESTAKGRKINIPEKQKLLKEIDNRKSRKSENEMAHSLSDYAAGALNLSEKATRQSRSKSIASESTCTRTSRSRVTSRSSSRTRPTSFIRSRKLHPEIPQFTKSDPVTLYQKYQKEWKKVPLPGENLHARVRWAVREKMLGSEPVPKPILKKSFSSMSVKKR